MAHDIVIRGGQLVDGIGGEPVRGDLAIFNLNIDALRDRRAGQGLRHQA